MKLATRLLASLVFLLPQTAPNTDKLAAEVKVEFMHAWTGYKQYAWGHDDLKPLSKAYRDWYQHPIYMTPVDSLDTMILMGFKDEAEKTRQLIVYSLPQKLSTSTA